MDGNSLLTLPPTLFSPVLRDKQSPLAKLCLVFSYLSAVSRDAPILCLCLSVVLSVWRLRANGGGQKFTIANDPNFEVEVIWVFFQCESH